jgi:taurine dioxygenase
MVRVHPRTGRRCIYYSEGAVSHIEGMSVEESAPILEAVRAHVLQPRFHYRHVWKVGDVVMWDNCSCIHKASADFEWPQRRRMHRTTLASPYAPIPA